MKKGLLGLLVAAALAVAPTAMAGAPADSPGNRTGGTGSIACNDGKVTWSPTTVWPPNHRMQTVGITFVDNERDGDRTSITVTKIVDGQAAADGSLELQGSGQPTDQQGLDWLGAGNTDIGSDSRLGPADYAHVTAGVRAERSGTDKAGRTYTITVRCTDTGALLRAVDRLEVGTGTQTQLVDLTVVVPHDQGRH